MYDERQSVTVGEAGSAPPGGEGVQIGQLGSAVSELSQMLSQAIVIPFRRRAPVGPPRRPSILPGRDGPRPGGLRGKGTLLVGAGTLADDQVVQLIHHVGGRQARVAVLPVAAYGLETAGARYRRPLERYGMDRLDTVPLTTRAQAEDTQLAARIAQAHLIVLGGGDAELLLGRLAGTGAGSAVAGALAGGATVCGLGAAAETVGEYVLVLGAGADAGPRLEPGLNLLAGTAVVAGHRVAGRLGSVFAVALAGNVRLLVLDDHAALLVRAGGQAEVRAGTVLIVQRPQRPAAEEAPILGEVVTRVVPAGWKLDLASGAVLPPGAPTNPRRP